MKKIIEIASEQKRPMKLLQFGQGNFLRGFTDYMVDAANEAGVCDIGIVMLKNTPGGSPADYKKQHNLYTVCLRGKQGGGIFFEDRIISSVQQTLSCYEEYARYMQYAEAESLRFIVSNTTETGIVFRKEDRLDDAPPSSFPAKLTQFLYRRYCHFDGDNEKGLVILPTELIELNGEKLLNCVEDTAHGWGLPDRFNMWLKTACIFASTLVDRIVTGFPKDKESFMEELGYEDALIDVAEPFALWVIEDKDNRIAPEFPLHKAGMPVVFAKDIEPYRERKVRILNGAHTASVLAAYLAGYETVFEMVGDVHFRGYIHRLLFSEVIPTLSLKKEELVSFANAVLERFENPFLNHALLSISLYSVSKWKMRLLPTLKEYWRTMRTIPRHILFSFAALLAFYSSIQRIEGGYFGIRPDGKSYGINDESYVLEFFLKNKGNVSFVRDAAENEMLWGENLALYTGFVELAEQFFEGIKTEGVRAAMENIVLSKGEGE